MRARIIACAVVASLELSPGIGTAAPQPIATEKLDGLEVLVEGGKLLLGANDVIVELHPPARPSDVRDVVLVATRPGVQSDSVNVDLSRDGAGRFHGTLTLPWTDSCRLEVAWDDQHGHHAHDFVVPVIVGHH